MDRGGRAHPISRPSTEFVESSLLDTCVPADADLSIEELVSAWTGLDDDASHGLLPFVVERDALFLDELVPVLVVLKTPYIAEDVLKSYVTRLALTVEAHATSTAAPPKVQGEVTGPSKELLHTEIISGNQEPFVFISKGEEVDDVHGGPHVYIIWKASTFLRHPRARLHRPAIYFTATASLRPLESSQSSQPGDEYMTGFEASPMNLFHAFANETPGSKMAPQLSAVKVTKVAPTNALARELVRPIRNATRRLYRATPAFTWWLRYSRWQPLSLDQAILATLYIEPTSYIDGSLCLHEVQVNLTNALVSDYTPSNGVVSRAECKTGDQLVRLFKLSPDPKHREAKGGSDFHQLDIAIKAVVNISRTCRPSISLKWRTNVSFTEGSSPKPAAVPERPISQASLSTSLSVPNSTPVSPLGGDALPNNEQLHEKQIRKHDLNEMTMSISISGPQAVRPGQPFKWNVFVVNRSEQQRRLALIVIPQRQRADARRLDARLPASSLTSEQQQHQAPLAIIDGNVLHAMQKSVKLDPLGLVCLSTDVRIGPLAPSACYDAELTFLPLGKGILGIEALRILDVQTQESAELRDLPVVFVSGGRS